MFASGRRGGREGGGGVGWEGGVERSGRARQGWEKWGEHPERGAGEGERGQRRADSRKVEQQGQAKWRRPEGEGNERGVRGTHHHPTLAQPPSTRPAASSADGSRQQQPRRQQPPSGRKPATRFARRRHRQWLRRARRGRAVADHGRCTPGGGDPLRGHLRREAGSERLLTPRQSRPPPRYALTDSQHLGVGGMAGGRGRGGGEQPVDGTNRERGGGARTPAFRHDCLSLLTRPRPETHMYFLPNYQSSSSDGSRSKANKFDMSSDTCRNSMSTSEVFLVRSSRTNYPSYIHCRAVLGVAGP